MVWARHHHEYDSAGQILVLLTDSLIRSLVFEYDVTGLSVGCHRTLCTV